MTYIQLVIPRSVLDGGVWYPDWQCDYNDIQYKMDIIKSKKDNIIYIRLCKQSLKILFKQIRIFQKNKQYKEACKWAKVAYKESIQMALYMKEKQAADIFLKVIIIRTNSLLYINKCYKAVMLIQRGLKFQCQKYCSTLLSSEKRINEKLSPLNVRYDFKGDLLHYLNKNGENFHMKGCKLLRGMKQTNVGALKIRIDKKLSKKCVLCAFVTFNMKKCGKCRNVYYCRRKCQKIHWKREHKYLCL